MTGVTGVKTRRSSSVLLGIQGQADGVNAVAKVSRCPVALTGEDMPEVATARSTPHLDSAHAMTDVLDFYYGIAGEW